MYKIAYEDIRTDSQLDAKAREREIIQRSIDLLAKARDEGTDSIAAVEALHFTIRVWSVFLEDLASEDNQLPEELRANLISIGIWILRAAEAIRQGESQDFDALIDVSEIIKDGIR